MMAGSGRRSLLMGLALLALGAGLNAAWVPAKAVAGQWLLERAWQQGARRGVAVRPWPWADTHPVAVLEIPGIGLRQLVLEGASGRNLAWGPTLLSPPDSADRVLSGHRDTHFERLQGLRPGDEILVTTAREVRRYAVAWLDIVDSRQQELVLEPGRDRLTLVTCYPFDSPLPGGPLRLVVTALPADRPQALSQAGTGKSRLRRNSGLNSLDW